jgi:hypothetical protein
MRRLRCLYVAAMGLIATLPAGLSGQDPETPRPESGRTAERRSDRARPFRPLAALDLLNELPGTTDQQLTEVRTIVADAMTEVSEIGGADETERLQILRRARERIDKVLTDRQRILFRRLSEDPGNEARYCRSLVLDLPTLTGERRRTVELVIAGVEGADMALAPPARRDGGAANGERTARLRDAEDRPAEASDPNEQKRALVTERFWLVMRLLLTPEEMAAVNAEMPRQGRRFMDTFRKTAQIPGLSASQLTEIQSKVEAMESETAADRAEMQRIRSEMREGERMPARNKELTDRAQAARSRLKRTEERLYAELLAVFTPAQRLLFEAVPLPTRPGSNARLHPSEINRLALTEDQRRAAMELLRPIREIAREMREKQRQAGGGDAEPEEGSPEAAAMMMERQQGASRMNAAETAALAKIAGTVLRPTDLIALILIEPETRDQPR